MIIETVYMGHSNHVSLILKSNSSAVDLSSVNKMTLRVGKALISSTNASTDMLLWNQSTYATGEMHIAIGESSQVEAGLYNAPLTVYTAGSSAGLVWAEIPIRIVNNVEVT